MFVDEYNQAMEEGGIEEIARDAMYHRVVMPDGGLRQRVQALGYSEEDQTGLTGVPDKPKHGNPLRSIQVNR